MPAAKRRINSTGRKRITRECVEIRLEPLAADRPLAASATIKLDGLDFPAEAAVVLEAYQRSSGMRFECGTVGDLKVPETLYLNEIDRGGSVLFRIKVIDSGGSGKILGLADRLRPSGDEDLEGRRSIFPIWERELGAEIWRVRITDAGPELNLNFRIPGFKHRILENPLLQGIMLPAAFRIVLDALASDPVPDDEDEEDWRRLWLRYIKETFGIDDDLSVMSEEERKSWVDSVVVSFCQAHEFVDQIRGMNDGGEHAG